MARFGMVSKLLAHTGRRSELVELLLAATREVRGADGCELYVVSQDPRRPRQDPSHAAPENRAEPGYRILP